MNETLRGLLTGTKIGDNLVLTIAWCAGVAVLSYAWSRRLYERQPKPLWAEGEPMPGRAERELLALRGYRHLP